MTIQYCLVNESTAKHCSTESEPTIINSIQEVLIESVSLSLFLALWMCWNKYIYVWGQLLASNVPQRTMETELQRQFCSKRNWAASPKSLAVWPARPPDAWRGGSAEAGPTCWAGHQELLACASQACVGLGAQFKLSSWMLQKNLECDIVWIGRRSPPRAPTLFLAEYANSSTQVSESCCTVFIHVAQHRMMGDIWSLESDRCRLWTSVFLTV